MTSKIRNFNEYLNESNDELSEDEYGLTEEQRIFLKKRVEGTWKMNDGKVDVTGTVNITFHAGLHIPVQFGKVTEHFWCEDNPELESLLGAPHTVGGNFNCRLCTKITSLKGSPKTVGKNFNCTACHSLTDLEGSPEEVRGEFKCSSCSNLTSLKGAPRQVGKSFDCSSDT